MEGGKIGLVVLVATSGVAAAAQLVGDVAAAPVSGDIVGVAQLVGPLGIAYLLGSRALTAFEKAIQVGEKLVELGNGVVSSAKGDNLRVVHVHQVSPELDRRLEDGLLVITRDDADPPERRR